jgi:hypothetical protein
MLIAVEHCQISWETRDRWVVGRECKEVECVSSYVPHYSTSTPLPLILLQAKPCSSPPCSSPPAQKLLYLTGYSTSVDCYGYCSILKPMTSQLTSSPPQSLAYPHTPAHVHAHTLAHARTHTRPLTRRRTHPHRPAHADARTRTARTRPHTRKRTHPHMPAHARPHTPARTRPHSPAHAHAQTRTRSACCTSSGR